MRPATRPKLILTEFPAWGSTSGSSGQRIDSPPSHDEIRQECQTSRIGMGYYYLGIVSLLPKNVLANPSAANGLAAVRRSGCVRVTSQSLAFSRALRGLLARDFSWFPCPRPVGWPRWLDERSSVASSAGAARRSRGVGKILVRSSPHAGYALTLLGQPIPDLAYTSQGRWPGRRHSESSAK